MTTKRIYGVKTKRRTYTVTDEVIKSLGDIGNGNRSKGLRICAGYHDALVEALRQATAKLKEYAEEDEEANGHGAGCFQRPDEFIEESVVGFDALLTEIAEAGK